MKRLLLVAMLIAVAPLRAAEVPQPAPPEDTPLNSQPDAVAQKRLAWWSEARFGMFIHWGLYSQDGCFYKGTNGGSEHMMQHLKIPLAEYAKIADDFNPTHFNADEWVSIAKNAGMKYMVITAKHHDGFAMFGSPSSSYNIVKRTPWHRDPVHELAEACRKQGLKFGVYYSLGRDWEDPDVPTKKGYRSNTWDYPDEDKKVFARYFARKVKPQIHELLTQYGPIAVLWFDTPEEISAAESRELVDYIHQLQPDCIVNSRVGHGLGDYGVQEQKIPGGGDTKPWETCMTLNKHWGYFKGDENWKPAKTVIQNIVDIASKGGNYLLNVGPTGAGVIPQGAVDDLQLVGQWMGKYGEAIYGTTASPLKTQPSWGRVTKKEEYNVEPLRKTKLYLDVFDWPHDGTLIVPDLKDEVARAYILGASPDQHLSVTTSTSGLAVTVPAAVPDEYCSVIVLELKAAK